MKSKIIKKGRLVCGLLLIMALYGSAKTDATETEVRRLEMDIPSLYLINGMFFSADQTKQLAGFLTESAKIHEQNQRAIRQFVLSHQAETDALIDQMIAAKKEPTPKSAFGKGKQIKELLQMRAEWHDLINHNQGNLDELARKTSAMLTPAQRDILDRFVPCFIPPGDFRNPERVGQADGNTSLGETMLARLRKAPPERLNEAIERALDGLVPYIMKEQHAELTKPQIEELRDELRPPLKELTDRIRGMNDSNFELEKANLAQQFLCLQNTQTDQQGDMGELVKIKRYLLNPGVVSIIAKRAGDPAADFSPGRSAPDFGELSRAAKPGKPEVTPVAVLEEVKQKNETFQTATLIHSLQLTAGQARQLLPCTRKAAAARAEIAQEAAAIFPPALKAYEALEKELENQQSSQPVEQEAGKYHHQLKILYSEKLAKTILECQTEMDQLLSADQVAFLTGRQNEKKKQAQKNITAVRSRAMELFDTMDKMNDKEFAGNVRNLCASFVECCVAAGGIKPADIDSKAEIERVEQALTRARSVKRAEYLKARIDLIAEICPRRNKPRPAVFGWQKARGDQLEVVDQTTQLLLSQTGLTLLEKKIKTGN